MSYAFGKTQIPMGTSESVALTNNQYLLSALSPHVRQNFDFSEVQHFVGKDLGRRPPVGLQHTCGSGSVENLTPPAMQDQAQVNYALSLGWPRNALSDFIMKFWLQTSSHLAAGFAIRAHRRNGGPVDLDQFRILLRR